jgi:hypothetical protein
MREQMEHRPRADYRMMVDAKKLVLVGGRVLDFWSDVSATLRRHLQRTPR